ncbi:hypothetical protein ACR6C2_30535 [Streptomyces sp. INA 01156]
MAALDILDSRPAEATVARGFEKVDACCWADSGDVAVYADRTYAFPGTQGEVAAHYRTAVARDGWKPDPKPCPTTCASSKRKCPCTSPSSPPRASRRTATEAVPTSPPGPATRSMSTRS